MVFMGCANCQRLEAENAALKRRVAELERSDREKDERIEALEGAVRKLAARAGLNSANSSMPPSSDLARGKDRPPRARDGDGQKRSRGGQPGHKGATRKPFPEGEVDRIVPLLPETCGGCGGRLHGEGTLAGTHQVVDVKPAPVEVTEYRMFARMCRCGATTTAGLPQDVSPWCLGFRLHAILTTLTGRFRISRREAEEVLVALYGPKAKVALGSIASFEGRTSESLAPVYEEATAAARSSEAVHLDETSWREGGDKAWLWAAAMRLLAVFRIDRHRSRKAYHRLMGENYLGHVHTDRYAAYHDLSEVLRQLCWSHLKRDFRKLADFGGRQAASVGRSCLRVHRLVMEGWRRHQAGDLRHASLRTRMQPVKRRLWGILSRGRRCRDPDAVALCRELTKHFNSLWTFARYAGVEPTNNRAERALRKGVLWRKGSFGSDSAAGSRFAERMLTVSESLRMQGRCVVDFVEAAIRARIAGTPAPSLLPLRKTG